MYESDFSLLVGKTLTNVDVIDEEVLFFCDDTSAFRAYHMQDCCEYVRIEEVLGDVKDLFGSKVVQSEGFVLDEWPEDMDTPEYLDSWTWTYHYIKTESGKEVTFKWLGTSNGYYSERVYFTRTHEPI